MDLLLDTHSFIWFVENDPKLPENTKLIIEDALNSVYLSIASLWEITIKIQLNKLAINQSIETILNLTIENGFEILSILPEHLLKLSKLGFYHRDPFDRIIIAQGLEEDFIIVSKDQVFDLYHVKRLWD